VLWHYKSFGFAVAAGVAGLAGFALANMLLTAHPTSFAPLSSVNYVAYVIIGGKSNMLGPVVGAILLVWAGDAFAFRGEYSQLLFGSLIVLVVLVARDGIVGTLQRVLWPFASSDTRSPHTVSTMTTSTATESRS
jgi:branched-chain amino acid transport system permease protein